jgi:regulatory protein
VAQAPYLEALKMLARRELSETQVRQRLGRRGHAPDAVDAAIARLKADGSLDDARTAAAIARRETSVRGRGRRRVQHEIERAGIPAPLARRAVDEAFADVDEDALIDAALARGLRGGGDVRDERVRQRLYRYLIGQGFDADRVLRVLTRRAPTE